METEMNVMQVALKDLLPYKNNPRKNKKAVDAVAASIREFGFKVPLVIDRDYNIVTGHTRYKAAQKLGYEQVPCIIADDLTDEQIKAYRLADNKVAELAEWDLDKLAVEMEGIDIDLAQFGFEELEIPENEVEEDYYEGTAPSNPKAKQGQVYLLGDHRLMCGDSTNPKDVEKLMAGFEADLIITDPPYNVDYEGTAKNLKNRKIENDSMDDDRFHNFLLDFYENMLNSLKRGGSSTSGMQIQKVTTLGERLKKRVQKFGNA